jgi:8-amino-7-oxononanoate synthase
VEYPIVPIGQSRLKTAFRGHNTEGQIKGLVSAIFGWVDNISAIEDEKSDSKASTAADLMYGWVIAEVLSGFGVIESLAVPVYMK